MYHSLFGFFFFEFFLGYTAMMGPPKIMMTLLNNSPRVGCWTPGCRNSSWAPTCEGAESLTLSVLSLMEVQGGDPEWLLWGVQGDIVPGWIDLHWGLHTLSMNSSHGENMDWKRLNRENWNHLQSVYRAQVTWCSGKEPGMCTEGSESLVLPCSVTLAILFPFIASVPQF